MKSNKPFTLEEYEHWKRELENEVSEVVDEEVITNQDPEFQGEFEKMFEEGTSTDFYTVDNAGIPGVEWLPDD